MKEGGIALTNEKLLAIPPFIREQDKAQPSSVHSIPVLRLYEN